MLMFIRQVRELDRIIMEESMMSVAENIKNEKSDVSSGPDYFDRNFTEICEALQCSVKELPHNTIEHAVIRL